MPKFSVTIGISRLPAVSLLKCHHRFESVVLAYTRVDLGDLLQVSVATNGRSGSRPPRESASPPSQINASN